MSQKVSLRPSTKVFGSTLIFGVAWPGFAGESCAVNKYKSRSGASGRNSATPKYVKPVVSGPGVAIDSGVVIDAGVAIEGAGFADADAACVAVAWGSGWLGMLGVDTATTGSVGTVIVVKAGVAGVVAVGLAQAKATKATANAIGAPKI